MAITREKTQYMRRFIKEKEKVKQENRLTEKLRIQYVKDTIDKKYNSQFK